jgi:hypothetical protein
MAEYISEDEKNKQDTIVLATKIFEKLKECVAEGTSEYNTPEKRYEYCFANYKNMFNQYPNVMGYMTLRMEYNEKAFRRYLDTIQRKAALEKEKDPNNRKTGDTMQIFTEIQALYGTYLYEQQCKDKGNHPNAKIKKEIYKSECLRIGKWVKDLKKSEKDSKSQYEKEERKNVVDKRKEFCDFLKDETEKFKKNNPEQFQKIKVDNIEEKLKAIEPPSSSTNEEDAEPLIKLKKEAADLETRLKSAGIEPDDNVELNEHIENMKQQWEDHKQQVKKVKLEKANSEEWISDSLVSKFIKKNKK